jgi:hypothetical protein
LRLGVFAGNICFKAGVHSTPYILLKEIKDKKSKSKMTIQKLKMVQPES